jgi:hypothetical protein
MSFSIIPANSSRQKNQIACKLRVLVIAQNYNGHESSFAGQIGNTKRTLIHID